MLAVKSWQLKAWAFLTGQISSGQKAELNSMLVRSLSDPSPLLSRTTRVASVDMGIRNLGLCVIEVPPLESASRTGDTSLTVKSWARMDLLKDTSITDTSDPTTKTTSATTPKAVRRSRQLPFAAVDKNKFTPSALSQTAYTVTQNLLSHQPDLILIERQRFRSGGAAAIQEWTVRVNMLESMLWACLETLRSESHAKREPFPKVLEISPARVANFWLSGSDVPLRAPADLFDTSGRRSEPANAFQKGRRKVEKKDKVALVRSWLSPEPNGGITIDFADEAVQTANSFALKGSRSQSATESIGTKLDDLADCLLQATTWVRWEENRQDIRDLYHRALQSQTQ